jgi:hypothetical protein
VFPPGAYRKYTIVIMSVMPYVVLHTKSLRAGRPSCSCRGMHILYVSKVWWPPGDPPGDFPTGVFVCKRSCAEFRYPGVVTSRMRDIWLAVFEAPASIKGRILLRHRIDKIDTLPRGGLLLPSFLFDIIHTGPVHQPSQKKLPKNRLLPARANLLCEIHKILAIR